MKKHKTKILVSIFSLFFFLFGIGVATDDCPKCENKIIRKEIVKEVKVGTEDYDLLKTENQKLKKEIKIRTQIMAIDNEAIANGADGLGLCADGIEAAYYGRVGTMESITAKVIILVDDTNKLAEQKIKLLLQLEQ